MNIFAAVNAIFKGLLCLIALPFILIAVIFKFVIIALGWLLSVALILLSIGVVLAAFAAVFAIPWLTKYRDSDFLHDLEPPRVVVAPDVPHTPRAPKGSFSFSMGPLGEVEVLDHGDGVFVGPDGHRVELHRLHTGDRRKLRMATSLRRKSVKAIAEVDAHDLNWDSNSVESDEGRGVIIHDTDYVTSDTPSNNTDADAEEASSHSVAELPCADEACDEERKLLTTAANDSATQEREVGEAGVVDRPRPEWVDGDESFHFANGLETIRVECGPCDSRAACDAALRQAMQSTVDQYLRKRAATVMADLNLTFFPWHEYFIQRTAERLHLRPSQEYLETHDTTIGDQSARTYFKYGLLEIPPALREGVDREIVSWARSFQIGTMWTGVLGAVASTYLLLKLNLARRFNSWSRWQRLTSAGGAAIVVACFLGAAIHLL